MDIQRDLCATLKQQQRAVEQALRVVPAVRKEGRHPLVDLRDLQSASPGALTVALHRLETIREWNCVYAGAHRPRARGPSPLHHLEPALLQFMIHAAPDPSLSKDIIGRWNKLVSRPLSKKRVLEFPSDEKPWETRYEVRDVPGAVGNVEARLGLVQVPYEGEWQLAKVWHVSHRNSSRCLSTDRRPM